MKKYALEIQRDPNCTVIDNEMLTDLQAAVQALEVARDTLNASDEYGLNHAEARKTVQLIDETLGEKKC
jgi:hypothetical protein